MTETVESIKKDIYKSINENIIKNDHYVLRSGKHSNKYIAKTLITLDPVLYARIITVLSHEILKYYEKKDFDVITGPAVAGICFAAPVALKLHKPHIFTEKFQYSDTNYYEMTLRKEFREYVKGKKIVIIEDVITTGSSVGKIAGVIDKNGGYPLSVFCIWNRDPKRKAIVYKGPQFAGNCNWVNTVSIHAIITEEIPSWPASECRCLNEGLEL